YGYTGANFVFASELKGLMPIPGFGRELNRAALASLMRHNYIPAPQSIYQGIHKLPPGTWLELAEAELRGARMPAPRTYWSALGTAVQGPGGARWVGAGGEAADGLEAVLSQAVGGRRSPAAGLGAYLAGGIDSSTAVALVQKQSAQPVRTFAIGVHEKGYTE